MVMVRNSLLVLVVLLFVGCTGGVIDSDPNGTPGVDGGTTTNTPWMFDGGSGSNKDAVQPNWDAFFAKDPPPKYCGPSGTGWKPPPLPGGTPDCPDDKNREGCPCKKKGQTAACWPGKRVNRNRGQCKDGVTTCQLEGEHLLRWGPCKGYVLPTPGVTKGAGACTCFSKGQWVLKNLAPCFVTYSGGKTYAVSTYLDSSGNAKCPTISSSTPPPKPEAGKVFSENTLTVDCAGQMKLCFTIKAGDYANPSSSDCVLAKVCTSAWYAKKDVAQKLPDLPSWSSNDATCAGKFDTVGGYGEMSVVGKSEECQEIDDGKGGPLVFLRVKYCPLKCAKYPSLPECKSCGNGASGSF